MKKESIKIIAGLIVLVMVASCAGSAKPAASGGLTLDQAIREASEQMDSRIEAGTKIALINFTSPSDQLSSYVLDELTANLVDSGLLTIIDRKEIDLIRNEMNFQMSGEVDDNSMQELGRMLGAQSIVSGSLTTIGNSHRIVIRVLNVQTAAVAVQYRNDIINDDRVQALLAGGRSGGTATATASSGQTGVSGQPTQASSTPQTATTTPTAPARPTAPKNGTYTFYPRLRAIQGAVEANAYLDRIVVRNGNLAVYLFNTPIGRGGGPGNPWVGTGSGGVILQDLDNPRRTWNIVSQEMYVDGYGVGGSRISFEGVTGRRFTLNSGTGYGNVAMIFEEIILDEPDED